MTTNRQVRKDCTKNPLVKQPKSTPPQERIPIKAKPLSSVTPVLGYRVPVPERNRLGLKEKPSRARMNGSGWLKLRLGESDINNLRAIAQCLGTSIDQVVRWGIVHMNQDFERRFGVKSFEAKRLTRYQRDALALQIWEVSRATMRVGIFNKKN